MFILFLNHFTTTLKSYNYMLTEALFQIVLSMAKCYGYKVPSYNESLSFCDVDSFVDWMIKNNPERKEEIEKKFEQFKKLQL